MNILSNELEPLFYWLLKASLQAGIIICLVFTVKLLFGRKLTAKWHYLLWLLVVARLVMPGTPQAGFSIYNFMPAPQSARHEIIATAQPETTPAKIEKVELQTTTEPAVIAEPTAATTQPAPIALADDNPTPVKTAETAIPAKVSFPVALADIWPLLWLAGAVLLAVYVFYGNFRLWRIIHVQRPVTDSATLNLLEDCKAQMKMHAYLALVETDKVTSPALFGFLRPRLLLPKGIIGRLDAGQLRHIFLHELAHLKRGDIYCGWLTALLQTLHWFNPLIWLAFHKMRADRELACDQLALAAMKTGENSEYGKTIVSLLEDFSAPQYNPGLAGILEDRSQLKRRIAMIASNRKGSIRLSIAAAVIMLVIGAVSLTDARVVTEVKHIPDVVANGNIATLSDGTKIELVGLCKEPTAEAKWWNIDGREMEIPKYIAQYANNSMRDYPVVYSFLTRISNDQEPAVCIRVYEGHSSYQSTPATDGTILCYVKQLSDTVYQDHAFEYGPIEIGVAKGEWYKMQGSGDDDIDRFRTYLFGSSFEIAIQPPQREKSSPEMSTEFWFTAIRSECQIKMVCTLKNGTKQEAMSTFSSGGGIVETGNISNGKMDLSSFVIDVPIEQIVDYELYYREFEFAQFDNVAFKPGKLPVDIGVRAKTETTGDITLADYLGTWELIEVVNDDRFKDTKLRLIIDANYKITSKFKNDLGEIDTRQESFRLINGKLIISIDEFDESECCLQDGMLTLNGQGKFKKVSDSQVSANDTDTPASQSTSQTTDGAKTPSDNIIVYVMGKVRHPGPYKMEPNSTLKRIIGSVGGSYGINPDEAIAKIERQKEDGSKEEIIVSLADLFKSTDNDYNLENNDLVIIASNSGNEIKPSDIFGTKESQIGKLEFRIAADSSLGLDGSTLNLDTKNEPVGLRKELATDAATEILKIELFKTETELAVLKNRLGSNDVNVIDLETKIQTLKELLNKQVTSDSQTVDTALDDYLGTWEMIEAIGKGSEEVKSSKVTITKNKFYGETINIDGTVQTYECSIAFEDGRLIIIENDRGSRIASCYITDGILTATDPETIAKFKKVSGSQNINTQTEKPDLAAVEKMVAPLKGIFSSVCDALNNDQPDAALTILEQAMPQIEVFKAKIKGTDLEVPIGMAIDQINNTVKALKAGDVNTAKAIINGLNQAGPELEEMIKAAAGKDAGQGTEVKSIDISWVRIDDPGVPGHEGFNGEMSKYETTNAQYCQYLNAALASGDIRINDGDDDFVVSTRGIYSGKNYYEISDSSGMSTRIYWTGSSFTVVAGFDDHPVTCVSWCGAMAFASYYGWRLPTEWEWQAVADYDGTYTYGCGTIINNSMANYKGSVNPSGTTVVGAFGSYGYGLCDMAGNACEWTSTIYPPGNICAIRGDCWRGGESPITVRSGTGLDDCDGCNGFRVCRDIDVLINQNETKNKPIALKVFASLTAN